jgi:hypothetical protein
MEGKLRIDAITANKGRDDAENWTRARGGQLAARIA